VFSLFVARENASRPEKGQRAANDERSDQQHAARRWWFDGFCTPSGHHALVIAGDLTHLPRAPHNWICTKVQMMHSFFPRRKEENGFERVLRNPNARAPLSDEERGQGLDTTTPVDAVDYGWVTGGFPLTGQILYCQTNLLSFAFLNLKV
jgi:hypothetical protein